MDNFDQNPPSDDVTKAPNSAEATSAPVAEAPAAPAESHAPTAPARPDVHGEEVFLSDDEDREELVVEDEAIVENEPADSGEVLTETAQEFDGIQEPPERKELVEHRHGSHERHGGRHRQGPHHGGPRQRPFNNEIKRGVDKSKKKEILVNCSSEETRVAVVEDGDLIELLIERTESEKIVGNIYKGRVENVLPGISSAFVNCGLEKNAYLYVSDVIPTGTRSRSSQIEKMIARNDVIMLQVAKEAIGTKGVKVTMDISLPGRFLVYMPNAEHLGVSKNIEDRKERERLRTIVESCAPEKGGVIIRTEAAGAEEQALRREMAYLTRLWENIQKRYDSAATPSLIHRDLGLVFQTVRDVFTDNTSIFLVDSRSEYRDLLDFLDSISPELKTRVKLYEGKTPLFQAFNIEQQIEKIRSARVDLPSGGYLIIQEAEGLCAVDVNTGKFTGKRSQEETVTATNVEAAKEVARQLRLRNIGGIIVIDFIDMRHARNRQKVMEALAFYVRDDRAKIKILPITRLGLIEMTRERKRESLFALLGEACPQCHASGRVLSRESMYVRLKREILTMTHGLPGNVIKIFLNPAVAHYFQERNHRLESAVKHKLVVQSDPHLPWEEYRILIE